MRESRASSIEPRTDGELSPAESLQPSAAGLRAERLYEDYSGRVYGYCLRRLGSPEEAEDALQATYLNAWRSLESGVEPISSRPWLFQIAANVCSSMLRTRLGGATVELRSPETFDRIPTEIEPNDDLLGLEAALEDLPERQRHALLLRDWRGLSYDEIAAEMNSSYEAVETLLFRARKAVAAGLRKPEPAKIPARARALAPLPLVIPFKHGVSSLKSAFTTSIAPIKVSLGIALGAAAPLVAYGLLERSMAHPPAAQTASPPVVRVESAPEVAAPPSLLEKTLPAPPPTTQKASGAHAAPTSHAGGGEAAAGVSHETVTTSDTHGDPAPPDPGSLHDPAPPPEPTPEPSPPPAADDDSAAGQVTICHHTGAKKNPTVTITVGADAVDAHLAHGDELGACAG